MVVSVRVMAPPCKASTLEPPPSRAASDGTVTTRTALVPTVQPSMVILEYAFCATASNPLVKTLLAGMNADPPPKGGTANLMGSVVRLVSSVKVA